MVRCFGYMEHKSGDDWVSACRKVERLGRNVWVEAGRLGECLNDDVKRLALRFGTLMWSVQRYV